MAFYLAVPAKLPKQAETNADRWKLICAVEASNTKRDQVDCMFKYGTQSALHLKSRARTMTHGCATLRDINDSINDSPLRRI